MNNLEKLNQIPIIETSFSCGEIDYILIENSEGNITTLKEIGMTEEDEGYMIDDGETIEVAYFAFNKLGATYWDSEKGFSDNTE